MFLHPLFMVRTWAEGAWGSVGRRQVLICQPLGGWAPSSEGCPGAWDCPTPTPFTRGRSEASRPSPTLKQNPSTFVFPAGQQPKVPVMSRRPVSHPTVSLAPERGLAPVVA